jgi:predicted Rossmann fold flavoprotein
MKTGIEAFDVIVIGGGPAGIMEAITKAEYIPKEFVRKYGKEGGFLLHSLSVFGVKETIKFFEEKGLKTKIEKDNRVFPKSNRAFDVLAVLNKSLKDNNVLILTASKVKKVVKEKNRITCIILENNQDIYAKNYIFSTGGKAFPQTGSTGDGYTFAEELGHTIENLRPALVPIRIKESWIKEAEGVSLKDVRLIVFQNNKKKETAVGDVVFTHFGLSGPLVLNISKAIGGLLEIGEVKIVLDLNPNLDIESLDKIIQAYFLKNSNKVFKNCLLDLLFPKMIPVIIEMSQISEAKKVSEITKEERRRLVKLLKEIRMTVSSLLSFREALITLGGVSLKEIDSKTMKSKLIENLFFAGEVINLHGPTGGYNLQLCWSTGYLAGQSTTIKN